MEEPCLGNQYSKAIMFTVEVPITQCCWSHGGLNIGLGPVMGILPLGLSDGKRERERETDREREGERLGTVHYSL